MLYEVITMFGSSGEVLFYLASRGHHADVGGISPGSVPPSSRTIEEEGVLSEGMKIVKQGHFCEEKLKAWLNSGKYPARNPDQNMADLRAQVVITSYSIHYTKLYEPLNRHLETE